jgi:nucleolar GTP-binding protein
MNFQDIKPVEGYKFYLDLAFRRAREKGEKLRGQKLKGSRIQKSKYIVLMKMQVISDTIISRMEGIGKSFPNFDDLDIFYKELIMLNLDLGQLRKSLAAVNWVRKQAESLFRTYKGKLRQNTQFDRINVINREYLGRVSSFIKQVKKDFIFLEEGRKTLKGLPTIKTSVRSVAIAGFPNVGKTTLLSKLTESKPEINTYPFTTKGINVAYLGQGKDKIQLVDIPGTLNRFSKMNDIERVAYLVLKHVADKIVYIFDLTLEYPLDKQKKLYERIKKEYGKEVFIFLSKTDIVDKSEVNEFKQKYPKAVSTIEKIEKIILS